VAEKRDYFQGETNVVTPEWASRARAAYKKSDFSYRSLAKAVGSSHTQVAAVLREKVETSDLVNPISRCLGIGRPTNKLADQDELELLRVARTLTKSQREALLAVARSFRNTGAE